MALSLILGILVSDLRGYRLLTRAHAQTSPCASQGGGVTLVSETVDIGQGISLNGLAVRNVLVNGQLVPEGVIAGGVRLLGGEVNGANGVIVGNDSPVINGVIVGNDAPTAANGVIVG